jgi:hypothetical protein
MGGWSLRSQAVLNFSAAIKRIFDPKWFACIEFKDK